MKKVLILIAVLCLVPSIANGLRGATFAWDYDDPPSDLAGFRLYAGIESGNYLYKVADITDINAREITVTNLPEGHWYFAMTAYDTETLESGYSNEVILAAYYYNTIRYDYNGDGTLAYKGEHTDQNASVDDPNWIITKYFYSGGMMTHMRIRITSWTDRSSGW